MQVTGGSVDVSTYFVLRLAADGTEATGLTITNFDLQYTRSGVAPTAKVDATALAATDSVHADNKAIEIDATDQPGLYRVDWPDAAFVAGVKEVILTVKCATCFTEHLSVMIDAPVSAILANGVTHGGNTAVLQLERLVATSTTTNEPGFKVTGNGSAPGVLYQGGATGNGANYFGGATSGHGFYANAPGAASYGFWAEGAAAGAYFEGGYGLYCEGIGAGGYFVCPGVSSVQLAADDVGVITVITNTASVNGLHIATSATGTAISASGLFGMDIAGRQGSKFTVNGAIGNHPGLLISGRAAGAGLQLTGGDTGPGLGLTGGAISGNGLNVTTTDGDGVYIDASGSGKVSINAVDGFNTGVYDAINATLSTAHGAGSWEGGGGGTGTGARTVTITVNDGAAVLEGAMVRLTKGAETYVAATNVSGVIVFAVDDGTWAVAISLPGYSFTPTTILVNGDEAATYSMTLVAISPSSPGMTTGYLYCYDEEGVIESGATVTITTRSAPATIDGLALDNTARVGTSAVDGLVQFTNLILGAKYYVRRGATSNHAYEVMIPTNAGATYELPSIVGN